MLKRFLPCVIFCGILISNAHAASYETMMRKCRKKMTEEPSQISVLVNYGKLRYDFSKDAGELEAMFKKLNPDAPIVGKIHGLTDISPLAAIDVNVSRQLINDNYICTIPQSVTIHLQYQNPTVYILKSLRKGSCPYRLALRHEQAHLDIGFTAMTLLGKIIKNKLPEIIDEIGPRITPVKDESNIAAKLSSDYQNYLMPTLDLFQNSLIEQQKALDTAENYQKESKICR